MKSLAQFTLIVIGLMATLLSTAQALPNLMAGSEFSKSEWYEAAHERCVSESTHWARNKQTNESDRQKALPMCKEYLACLAVNGFYPVSNENQQGVKVHKGKPNTGFCAE
jgi:hypothetical protein